MSTERTSFMTLALAEAERAGERGEVPVGAVLVDGVTGAVLAAAGNRIEALADPTSHAEMLVLRAGASARSAARLDDCDLYVTLEPCAMCAGAASLARVARIVFAADDPKGGAVLHGPRFFEQPTCHHRPTIARAGDADAVSRLLKGFFQTIRASGRVPRTSA